MTNDSGKQSAAVKLALGETQIVADTRNFLEEQGVVLDAFSLPPSSRSKSVLLIKNLPAKTPVEEIRDMFAKFGEVGRVVLPPNGITGLVEFYESSEAKIAFRRLAYTKYKGAPLYLEWAPENSLKSKSLPAKGTAEKAPLSDELAKGDEKACGNQPIKAPDENTTLFVKNLNFDTTDEGLKTHFEHLCGKDSVFSANISR